VIGAAPFLDTILPSYVDAIRGRIEASPTAKPIAEPKPTTTTETATADEAKPAEPPREEPDGWADRHASIFYGFDARNPDLFYEIVALPLSSEIGSLHLAKLRRAGDVRPKFVVAIFGDADAIRRFRNRVELESPARYARCTTPASEIAPDATYGAETRTHTEVLAELREKKVEVVAKS
jgi:hypothetical protein